MLTGATQDFGISFSDRRSVSSPRRHCAYPGTWRRGDPSRVSRSRCSTGQWDVCCASLPPPSLCPRHRHAKEAHLVSERLAKARFERTRIEPERAAGLLVAPEVGNARDGPDSLGPRQAGDPPEERRGDVHSRRADAGDSFGDLKRLDQRMPWSRDDVRFPRHALLHREEMAAGGVIDVGPAVRSLPWQCEQTAPQIPDESWTDLARVSRTVVQARLHDNERQTLMHHRLSDLIVGEPFGPIVLREPRAPPVDPVRLVDELTVGVGEDGERARVHAFRDPEAFHRIQDVPRALDVDALALRAVLGPDLVPARDVEHAVHSGHRGPERFGNRDVPRADVDAELSEIGSPRRIPDDRDDLVATLDELPDHPTADEARGAGHKVLRPSPPVASV